MDFIDIIDNFSKEDKNKVAQIYRDNVMTYKQLTDKSNALAVYLIEKFGKDKTPVIIYGHKQSEMLISFFACSKSGHPYIPVDITFPPERIRDIIESSGAKLILCVSDLDFNSDEAEILDLRLINSIIEKYLGNVPDRSYRTDSEDIYYILYTSGSTGKPKGVKITKGCITNFMNWFTKMCKVTGDSDVIMNQISYSFDVSVIPIYIGLSTGKILYVIDKDMVSNFKDLFDNLKKSHISLWVTTPSFAEMCMIDKNFNKELLPDMKKMIFAGEILTHKLMYQLYDRFGEISIINGYGPTESTVLATAVELDKSMCDNLKEIPIGYPADNCQIYFIDENGNRVKDGEKGELVICGDSVSTGYYNNEEITRRVFSKAIVNGIEKRVYKTGDLAYIKDGLIYYCGRKDFQIKLNGYRIELEDIESNLRKIDFVENSVAMPIFKDGKPSHVTAFVTLNECFDEKEFKTVMKIKDELKKLIPTYMVPRVIKIKNTFPMNTNGKIDRKALLEELK